MMDEESDHRRTTEEPDTAQKIEYDLPEFAATHHT